MRRVLIESPFSGNVARNIAYARACLGDSLSRGEAPIASHLLYTQPGVLDDADESQRWHGIDAGLAWCAVADAVAVYTDLGVSSGMEHGIKVAEKLGRPIEYREVGDTHGQTPACVHFGDNGARGLCFSFVDRKTNQQHVFDLGFEQALLVVELGMAEVARIIRRGGK